MEPIFNKSFVKKEVYGSREQYMRPTAKRWMQLKKNSTISKHSLNLKVGFVHIVFVGLKMPSTFSIFPRKITTHFSF